MSLQTLHNLCALSLNFLLIGSRICLLCQIQLVLNSGMTNEVRPDQQQSLRLILGLMDVLAHSHNLVKSSFTSTSWGLEMKGGRRCCNELSLHVHAIE